MRSRRAAWLLAPPLLFLLAFWAYPLSAALEAALADGDAWGWLRGDYATSRLRLAILQALLSALLTMAIAAPLAWFHHRRRIPFTRALLAVHAAPFVLPVFVVVFGLSALLGPALDAVGPLGAVVVAHAYYNYGFAARLLHAALEHRPRRLEDAARALGATPRDAFARASLPLLLPSFAAAGLLAFVFAFASFGVVLYLGEGEVATLDTLVYENVTGAFARYDRAAVVGVLQLAVNAAALSLYLLLRRREARLPREPLRDAPPPRAWEAPLATLLAALALAPAAAVLVGAFRLRGAWSLEPLAALVDAAHPAHVHGFDLSRALQWSLLYAAASVAAALLLTALLAYGLRAAVPGARRAIEVASALPLGASSLLLGFGYLLAFGAGDLLDLRGKAFVVVVAHTLLAFPFASRALLPALDRHDPRLDDAARTLGARPLAVALRVHLPLFRAPLVVAAGLAAAFSLGDFGASLVLMRPDTMSLSVWIHRHGGVGTFDPLLRAQSHALAAILLVLTAVTYAVVEWAGRAREVRF